MGRRNQGALVHRGGAAAGGVPPAAGRRAILANLRRGYRDMGQLNLALAEEGLVFEHLSPAAKQPVRPGDDP